MALHCVGDDDLRANMERRRIKNARSTALRQRKWQELRMQKEEEEKKKVRDILEHRRRERARLNAYIHSAMQPHAKDSQLCSTQQNWEAGKVNMSRAWWENCMVQNQEFANRIKQCMKSAVQSSFLRAEISERLSLNDLACDDNLRQIGTWNEDTRPSSKGSIDGNGRAKNLRVTFHPAALVSKEEASTNMDKVGATAKFNFPSISLARPVSPTIVLDGPDIDSSSNSSFAAHNVESITDKLSLQHHEDMNTFLEEALQLRVDNEAATTRLIAEVTALESRLEDCKLGTLDFREEGTGKDRDGVCHDQPEEKLAKDGLLSFMVHQNGNRNMLGSVHKICRSEAWETSVPGSQTSLETTSVLPHGFNHHLPSVFSSVDSNVSQPRQLPSHMEYQDVVNLYDQVVPSQKLVTVENKSSCEPVSRPQSRSRCYREYNELSFPKISEVRQKGRKADFVALSEEEDNVLASLERLDWKLASAIGRCRDSGTSSLFSDGHFSTQSAPTVIAPSGTSTSKSTSSIPRTTSSARAQQTSHSPSRPRRRQNVGLTNKCHERKCKAYSISSHKDTIDGYSTEMNLQPEANTTAAASSASSIGTSATCSGGGVIVFRPDAYQLLNKTMPS